MAAEIWEAAEVVAGSIVRVLADTTPGVRF